MARLDVRPSAHRSHPSQIGHHSLNSAFSDLWVFAPFRCCFPMVPKILLCCPSSIARHYNVSLAS